MKGRPSQSWKKVQVLIVLLCWAAISRTSDRHGPPFFRSISRWLQYLSPFQIIVLAMNAMYVLKNVDEILGLGSPQPLANLYSKTFYRASWFTTALDAGFWTAMQLKPKFLKDLMSIVFSLYYLVFAEAADEKVRKFRATATIEHVRISWEKNTNPYLSILSLFSRPHISLISPLKLERPFESCKEEDVKAWLYFDGTKNDLLTSKKIILYLPGGGVRECKWKF